jgi:hypothetical protein
VAPCQITATMSLPIRSHTTGHLLLRATGDHISMCRMTVAMNAIRLLDPLPIMHSLLMLKIHLQIHLREKVCQNREETPQFALSISCTMSRLLLNLFFGCIDCTFKDCETRISLSNTCKTIHCLIYLLSMIVEYYRIARVISNV